MGGRSNKVIVGSAHIARNLEGRVADEEDRASEAIDDF